MKKSVKKHLFEFFIVIVALILAVIVLLYPIAELIVGIIMTLFASALLITVLLKQFKICTNFELPSVLKNKKGIFAVIFILLIGITMTLQLYSGHTQKVYEHLLSLYE